MGMDYVSSTSTGVGYAWTFAFLLVAFSVVAIAWAAASSSTFQRNVFVGVLLAGTVGVIVRTMYNVVLYDRLSTVLKAAKGGNPYADSVSTTCPDFHSFVSNDTTGNPVCENVYRGRWRIGTNSLDVTDLAQVDRVKECERIAANANDRPWTAMRKFCEYSNRL